LIPDAAVVERVLDGDREAYAVLVERYQRSAHAVAIGILRDFQAAEDATQEAFVAAFEKLGDLRKPERFGPWLIRITRRKALDALRQRRVISPPEQGEEVAIDPVDPALGEASARLLAEVQRLPGKERQTVMLRHFDGLGVKEIALHLGQAVGTVTKSLSRAHARLRKRLRELEP
jgi:RNA polymerase sigma factor (sigma-70 family)